jgi:hypothetical protein
VLTLDLQVHAHPLQVCLQVLLLLPGCCSQDGRVDRPLVFPHYLLKPIPRVQRLQHALRN